MQSVLDHHPGTRKFDGSGIQKWGSSVLRHPVCSIDEAMDTLHIGDVVGE